MASKFYIFLQPCFNQETKGSPLRLRASHPYSHVPTAVQSLAISWRLLGDFGDNLAKGTARPASVRAEVTVHELRTWRSRTTAHYSERCWGRIWRRGGTMISVSIPWEIVQKLYRRLNTCCRNSDGELIWD